MNIYGNTIRKCGKCENEIKGKNGWYLQTYNRKNRSKRDNTFLCEKCYKELENWVNKR